MGQEIFPFSIVSRPTIWPTLPPAQWVQGPISSEEERQGHEAEKSPPRSAEVKNVGAVLHSSIRLHAVVLSQ
jgi:hypothetical protein